MTTWYLGVDEENEVYNDMVNVVESNNTQVIADNAEVTEDPIIDYTLFNNYWLNEIKAQDDVAKQIMSICAVLLGVYATVILNNIDKFINIANVSPSIGFLNRSTINGSQNVTSLVANYPMIFSMEGILFLLMTTFTFVMSLTAATRVLQPAENTERLLEDSAPNHLKQIAIIKHSKCRRATRYLQQGMFFSILSIIIISIVYMFLHYMGT